MLRLLLAFVIALAVTLAAGVGWLVATAPVPLSHVIPARYIPLVLDTLPFVLALLILCGAILLFRKSKSWPSILLLAGAVSLLLVGLHELVIGLSFAFHLIPAGRSFLFPLCTENPLITRPVGFLRVVSLFVLVGLFCYVFQATRGHLTRRSS